MGGESRRAGFTLIELLVVMGVLAMMAALAAPRLQAGLPGASLRAEAAALGAALSRARSSAIRTGRETWVAVDPEARAWRASDAPAPHPLPEGMSVAMTAAAREVVGNRVGRIRFYPDGTATGGTVRLAAGGRARALRVDWFDGGVRVDARPQG